MPTKQQSVHHKCLSQNNKVLASLWCRLLLHFCSSCCQCTILPFNAWWPLMHTGGQGPFVHHNCGHVLPVHVLRVLYLCGLHNMEHFIHNKTMVHKRMEPKSNSTKAHTLEQTQSAPESRLPAAPAQNMDSALLLSLLERTWCSRGTEHTSNSAACRYYPCSKCCASVELRLKRVQWNRTMVLNLSAALVPPATL